MMKQFQGGCRFVLLFFTCLSPQQVLQVVVSSLPSLEIRPHLQRWSRDQQMFFAARVFQLGRREHYCLRPSSYTAVNTQRTPS